MACKITINSPITGEKAESLEYNKILDYVKNDSEAMNLYSKLDSPEFKNWFGDWVNSDNASKVVNEIGEPLLLFHSTFSEFSEFDTAKSTEEGFHFGTRKAALQRRGTDIPADEEMDLDLKEQMLKSEIGVNMMPVFLNIRNMIEGADYLEADKLYDKGNLSDDAKEVYAIDLSRSHEFKALVIAFLNKNIINKEQAIKIIEGKSTLQLETGADGYWYTNELEDKGERSYVVFNPSNIKSLYNVGTYSSKDDNIYKQSQITSSKASKDTLDKFREWAKRLNLTGNYLTNMVINGKKYNANGIADIARNAYYVLNGKESTSEPEEITHFIVEFLEESNPKLFNKMLSAIRDYKIYNTVKLQYSEDPNYQKDGKPDIRKIKKEAIAKLLVEQIIKKEEGLTEKPELLLQSKTWWQQIKEWFKSLINKAGFNPFEQAIEQLDTLQPIKNRKSQSYTQINQNQINAALKVVKLISDNIIKVNRLYTNLKDTDNFWNKIQQDLQIPKNQINLLKESKQEMINNVFKNLEKQC